MKCISCRKVISKKFHKPICVSERFWSRVSFGKKCWTFKHSSDGRGYGRVTLHGGHVERASRISWILSFGKIPRGVHVLHRCDNRPCVRPSHLFLGTHTDNMRDMFSKDRRTAALGRQNGRSKLTEAGVRKIRSLYATGKWSTRAVAKAVGISYVTVRGVLQGRQWSWLPCPKKTLKAIAGYLFERRFTWTRAKKR